MRDREIPVRGYFGLKDFGGMPGAGRKGFSSIGAAAGKKLPANAPMVPVNDDIMLSYQDTSYHDNATLRELSGRLPAPEFHQWMMKRGLIDEKGVLTELAGDASIFLQ